MYGNARFAIQNPGDEWQKFANAPNASGVDVRASGKKLLFMGGEFVQRNE